jgi:regulator of sigma E protease
MSLLYFILLIGVLIFVHEVGHFLFAKLFDVKVIRFSLGFGPQALGFRRGETDYCIAWIPLGGYVKMLGEDPSDEIVPADQGRAFQQKPLWQRYIVVLAGPAFNLIFPILIYFPFFAMQPTTVAAVVGKVFPGQPAAEAGLKRGDRILAIEGKDIYFWEDMVTYVSERQGQSIRFSIKRDGQRLERFVTPVEQVMPDRLNLEKREGRIGVANYFELAQIGISDPSSQAARAGLQTGDLVTSVNGAIVESWPQLEQILHKNRGHSLNISYLRPSRAMSQFFSLRVLRPAATVVDPEPKRVGDKLVYDAGIFSAEFFVAEVEKDSPMDKIGMRPGDRVTRFDGKPIDYWETMKQVLDAQLYKNPTRSISWVPYGGSERTASFKQALVTYLDEYRQKQQVYVFGVKNQLIRRVADPAPIEGRFSYALSQSVGKIGEIVSVTAIAIVQIFRGAIPSDTIGGPLMLYQAASVAAKKGWDHFLWTMALISINLGILNLLPIPVLDGGHVLFFSIEAIKRRPLSLRVREIFSYVGLMLLISLMIFALRNDLIRLWAK